METLRSRFDTKFGLVIDYHSNQLNQRIVDFIKEEVESKHNSEKRTEQDKKEEIQDEMLNLVRRFYELFPHSSHFKIIGIKGLRIISIQGLIKEIVKYIVSRRDTIK